LAGSKKGRLGALFSDKIGDSRRDYEVNARIDTIRARVMQIHREMELDGESKPLLHLPVICAQTPDFVGRFLLW
jgi:hypothetical protein